jgi:hypothetical protein
MEDKIVTTVRIIARMIRAAKDGKLEEKYGTDWLESLKNMLVRLTTN